MIEQTPTVKPLFRWAGSKRKLLPELSSYWKPWHRRYIEPFAGSSCLFFALQPASAVLSDKNPELIAAYQTIRDDPIAVHRSFSALPRNASTYYHLRQLDPTRLSRFDRAVRFTYLNRNCFNGIYRTNLAGEFNVPFATSRSGAYPSLRDFMSCAQLLQSATLKHCDFGSTLRSVRAGDFVYLDPPYAVSQRRVFSEYGKGMFTLIDLPRLQAHLHNIHGRGATFLMSYADSREARSLAADWFSRRIRTRRHVAGFKDARRYAHELLITNLSQ